MKAWQLEICLDICDIRRGKGVEGPMSLDPQKVVERANDIMQELGHSCRWTLADNVEDIHIEGIDECERCQKVPMGEAKMRLINMN